MKVGSLQSNILLKITYLNDIKSVLFKQILNTTENKKVACLYLSLAVILC